MSDVGVIGGGKQILSEEQLRALGGANVPILGGAPAPQVPDEDKRPPHMQPKAKLGKIVECAKCGRTGGTLVNVDGKMQHANCKRARLVKR